MKIGVIGAGGRLGGFMIEAIVKNGFSGTAIARERRDAWPDEIHHMHHSDRSDYTALGPVFDALDVVIIAAGLTSTAVHELALAKGCHVIDVGVSENHIRACLELDDLARSAGKCLIAMAGLAPGLMGLLALHMSETFPDANNITLCLTQSAKGSAGEQGTRDMLDMLTDTKRSRRLKSPVVTGVGRAPSRMRAYTFPTVEEAFLTGLSRVSYTTRFDRAYFNTLLRVLRGIRAVSPALYRSIRNKAARQKRASDVPMDEQIFLSAVAMAADGTKLGATMRAFGSDYGATAAIVVALADLAVSGKLQPAAGHPDKFTNWDDLAAHPIVRREQLSE